MIYAEQLHPVQDSCCILAERFFTRQTRQLFGRYCVIAPGFCTLTGINNKYLKMIHDTG